MLPALCRAAVKGEVKDPVVDAVAPPAAGTATSQLVALLAGGPMGAIIIPAQEAAAKDAAAKDRAGESADHFGSVARAQAGGAER